jgi:hypothetical protein
MTILMGLSGYLSAALCAIAGLTNIATMHKAESPMLRRKILAI